MRASESWSLDLFVVLVVVEVGAVVVVRAVRMKVARERGLGGGERQRMKSWSMKKKSGS